MDKAEKMSDELKLLLTVARILRARLPELAPPYQDMDLLALNEALAPWESTITALHPNGEPSPTHQNG